MFKVCRDCPKELYCIVACDELNAVFNAIDVDLEKKEGGAQKLKVEERWLRNMGCGAESAKLLAEKLNRYVSTTERAKKE